MNLKEFAKTLDGRNEGVETTKLEELQAKELGYVIVFGYSDDNVEFRGAIDDEAGCFNGGEVYLDENGIFEECEEECKYSKAAKEKCKELSIECEGEEGYFWTYEIGVPHETFDILDEEGNKWCQGIVFELKEVR
jgi:hypothetical protein